MTDSVPHFGADNHPNMDALSEFVSGDGTPEWRAAVEEHLAQCAACREDVRSLRGTVALLHALPQIAPPVSFQLGPEYARRTSPATGTAAGGSGSDARILRLLPVVRVLSVAAVLLFLVIGGVSFYEGRFQDDAANNASDSAAPMVTSETEAPAAAFQESEGETSSEAPPKSAAVAPSQAGVVDRGESASASGDRPVPADAAQESEATPPGSLARQSEAEPTVAATADKGNGFPWFSTAIGLGVLAIILVGLWVTLTRITRSR